MMGDLYKRGNKEDNNDDLDNVRVLVFRGKKVVITTTKAAKLVVKKLMAVPIIAALEGKGQN